MYIHYNANPDHNRVGDCTVRAISAAYGIDWDSAYIRLALHGYLMKAMPDEDVVWWDYLETHGFRYRAIHSDCPRCVTVQEFCREHPRGRYILATQKHVLYAQDGDWYDTWNSGGEIVLHYWEADS